jgi:tetratricopeptide (TPR) repeat protein
LLHIDKENDLVILKAKGKDLPAVKIGDIAKMNIGEKVYVISSPQGLENTISDGILSGIRDIEGTNKKILQITAPVSKGSSGGAVFNKDGEIIGIATFIIEEAQNLNFAMPVNVIKGKIESKKVIALKDSEIEDYEKTAEYWFYLGYYLGETGMYQEAIEAYKQAIRIKPDLHMLITILVLPI